VTNVCAQEAFILVVHPSVSAQNVQEFVALGRRPDNKLAYSTPGVGNNMHLAGALFDARAKTSMTHVPYKGGGPAIAALLGGEIQAMFSNTTLAMPHIRVAKLRALAVTGRTRLAALPEVPTLTESGVPGMEIDAGWFGLFAPAKTPLEIINRLHSEVRTALAKPAAIFTEIAQGRRSGALVAFPADIRKHLIDQYAYAEGELPAGTYPTLQSGPVPVTLMDSVILVHESVPDDIAYKITKTLIRNRGQRLVAIHASMGAWDPATSVKYQGLPLHPGAIKAFREAGIAVG
jgi:TRAP-type uncharacterized transport system substrate-binding protein